MLIVRCLTLLAFLLTTLPGPQCITCWHSHDEHACEADHCETEHEEVSPEAHSHAVINAPDAPRPVRMELPAFDSAPTLSPVFFREASRGFASPFALPDPTSSPHRTPSVLRC